MNDIALAIADLILLCILGSIDLGLLAVVILIVFLLARLA